MHWTKLIALTICLEVIDLVSGERCPQSRYVPKTRLKQTQKPVNYWTTNWLGFRVQRTRLIMGSETEYYTEAQIVWVCCPGYMERDSLCEPICTPTCPSKSRCSEPNRCICNFGYSSLTSDSDTIICEPKCPTACPANSNCTSLFQCTCNQGFRERIDGSCEPICTTLCPNHASCSAPETCSCSQGYRLTDDGQECVPECKYGCALNMYCQSPDQCSCRTGYNLKSKMQESAVQSTELSNEECLPVCTDGCPARSNCVAPEVCRCEEGYTMLTAEEAATSISTCVPVCEERCPLHASCMLPNQCECAPGYEMHHLPQHRPYCEAQCAQNCSINGKCVSPNVCECFDGYEHVRETNATANLQQPYCEPKCSNDCQHGTCFAPEVCVCQPGYLMGEKGECEPICSRSCQHGRCIQPEMCACHEGYRLSAHDYSNCEPICQKVCINADCAAPDICLCHDKFKPKTVDNNGTLNAYECEPMCMPECEQGDCIAPDQCGCHTGYVPHENTTQAHICQPECKQGCEHGICVAPDVCVCGEAFELNSETEVTKCIPIAMTDITTEATTDTMPTKTINFPSTDFMKDWHTKGLIVGSLTTLSEPKAGHLLPSDGLQKCTDVCYCWKENDAGHCLEVCDMGNEKCLDPEFAQCDEVNKRILYADGTDANDGAHGAVLTQYQCGANRTVLPPQANNSTREPLWLLIGGVSFIVIMLIGIVYFCVRIYQTRHDTGAHDIPISLLMKL